MENQGFELTKEDQDLLMQASLLENQSRELENNLEMIEKEITELGKFKTNLEFLDKSENKEMISSVGKGVFLKAELKEKKLFVNVGNNILVRKSIENANTVIEDQIKRLNMAKTEILGQLETFTHNFTEILSQLEKLKESRSKSEK